MSNDHPINCHIMVTYKQKRACDKSHEIGVLNDLHYRVVAAKVEFRILLVDY